MHLSLAEIRRLTNRLIHRRPAPVEYVLHWSHWRRKRQYQARLSHYKRRGHTPPETVHPSQQTPLQY
ncbi:hypothetical protein DT019_39000 [Streptomyces sp. SDr-06]|nr:hypothetical protein DT019_39000 [Streptomyces sp. SDr-06]